MLYTNTNNSFQGAVKHIESLMVIFNERKLVLGLQHVRQSQSQS